MAHFKLSLGLSPKTKDMEHVSGVPYVSAVGSIMSVMVYTRLDISHTVSMVNRFIKNPGEVHWHDEK